MSKGTHMATEESLRDEAHCEVRAIGYELAVHDSYELTALKALDSTLGHLTAAVVGNEAALQAVVTAQALVRELRRRDVIENRRHRDLVGAAAGVVPQ